MGYIESIQISCVGEDNTITAPPARILEMFVIEGILTLRQRPVEDLPKLAHERDDTAEPILELDVPARSVLIALQALLAEDDAPQPPHINR
jgi:hypothetical protein